MAKTKDIVEDFEADRPVRQRALKVNYLRTGCTLLDTMVGGGVGTGYPVGKIINFEGNSSSGKTFFACELIAAAVHQYKDKCRWVYDDAEKGFSFDGKALWGVDIIPENEDDRVFSDTVEDLYGNIRAFLKSLKKDEVGIYVVDSLDALCNDEMVEEGEARMKAFEKGSTYSKGSYNLTTQKFLSQVFFRTISAELDEKNCLLVFISQMRDNLNAGLYGEKDKKSGGRALDFYCHTVIRFKRKESFEQMGRAVGSCVEATLKKSKTPRPYRKCLINLRFDYGIDDISTNIDYVYNLKSEKTGLMLGETAQSNINLGDTSNPNFGKYDSSLDGIKQFMTDNGLFEKCRTELKAEGQKCNKENYIAWLKENPDRRKLYEECYGIPVTRDELIEMADRDREVRRQLKIKAVDKWEGIEDAISCKRKKYDDDEEDY